MRRFNRNSDHPKRPRTTNKFNLTCWNNKRFPKFENISYKDFKELHITPQIALLTANTIERDAVFKELSNISKCHSKYKIIYKAQTYYIAKFAYFTVVVLKSGEMGTVNPAAATLTVNELISVWNPSVIIAVGIAMGLKPNEQKCGDVLISKTIVNYNVNKVTEEQTIDRSTKPNASIILVDRFTECTDWNFKREDGSKCKCFAGLITTGGSLVNQPEFTRVLKNTFKDAIGNEMEASGVWAASERHKKHWIIVKGICDWGEKKTDNFQPLAAAAAVSLCKKVLSNPDALDGIVKKKSEKTNNDNNTRINSLLLFYYRKRVRDINTNKLSTLTGISETRIKTLESFVTSHGTFDSSSFPECTKKEINILEKKLETGNKKLQLYNNNYDFMGYYLSYYYKNKLKIKFNKFKVVIFDFDGTLTFDSTNRLSTWQRIWLKLGYSLEDCTELHGLFSNNKITHEQWCNLTCSKFKEKDISINTLKEVANEMKLIEGCIPTLKKLKEKGIFLYINSGSIRDVIHEVIGKNNITLFEDIRSNRMQFDKNGHLLKIIGTKFDFAGKAGFIKEVYKDLDCKPYEILFVGNSNNDEWAYKSGAITLCVNPTETNSHNTKIWHNNIYNMQNLDEILKYFDL